MHVEFTEALLDLGKRPDVRVVLLSAGGKVFSAGGDFNYIEGLAADRESRKSIYETSVRLFSAVVTTPVPIVAAVHGDAMGVGATIVTASDIVVTTPTVRFADPHVVVGLCAGDGGVASWSASVGLMRAKRHLLTGDPITGREAHAWGLVTDLVDDAAQVREEALRIASKIASLPPVAVQGTKRAFGRLMQDFGMAAFEISLAHEVRCLETQDLLEAVAAAKARRKGQYRGL
jgi:enoyl-CoA hydratase